MKYSFFIILSAIWALIWAKIAILLDQELLKNIILISLSMMFICWVMPKRKISKIKINENIKYLFSGILFFTAWIYSAIVWAGAWILFSMLFMISTWLWLKQITWYRLITAWINIIWASIIFFLNDKIDWNIVIIWFFAALIGWYLWAHLLHKINEKILKILFSMAVLWTIILILLK